MIGHDTDVSLRASSHPEFDARVRIYALRPEPMVHLLRWLEESERRRILSLRRKD